MLRPYKTFSEKVTKPWLVKEREELAEYLGQIQTDVVVSFGAGNIDAYCQEIADELMKKA